MIAHLRPMLGAFLAAGLLAGLVGAPASAAVPRAPQASAVDDGTGVPGPSATPDPAPGASPTVDPGPSPEPPATPAPAGSPDASDPPTPTASADASASAPADPSTRPTQEPGTGPTGDPAASPTGSPDASPTSGPSASPSPTPAPTAPPLAPWSGRFNLYRASAWVRQYTSYTCTAASAQTMLNIILRRSDRTSILQMRIIRYARTHDSLRSSLGSDPQGWARALTYFGGGAYAWRTLGSRASALRWAALRMVLTRKPVGLLVWRGHHAWTMTGFTSATDPRTDPHAVITGIWVAPPLVGTDPRPNTYIRSGALATFARYRETDGRREWIGWWVVVAP